jgi:putative peptide zinc metalloprotease protein
MYCNTSDSWILPNKWHRIAIGAAGMYVEVVLASVCTFIWWYTHPCAIHYMALNVIFLCGISTLLFNANPLLRYDGYYMLSDYLEIPNLAQKSKTALTSQLRVSVGMKPIESRLQPTRNQLVFALYAVASFVYRWFVMLMIFWFLTKFFEPYGLSVLGHLMIVASLVGMVVIPLFKVGKFFMYPGRLREVKRPQVIRTVSVLVACLALLFLVPLPHSIRCAFVVQPNNAQHLYVSEPGVLKQVNFAVGDQVTQGDVIAVLENEDVAISLERLRGQLAGFEANLAAYRLNATKLADGSRMISETRLSILDVKKRIRLVSEQQSTLQLVAQRSGIIIEPPFASGAGASGAGASGAGGASGPGVEGMRLVKWTGSPMESENRSAFLERGTLFCLVGEPVAMKATLVIDESIAKFAAAGQRVDLMFDEHAGQRIYGVIESVSREPLQYVPRELDLQNGGTIATQPAAGGQSVPMITSYEATVQFDDQSQYELLTGFRGQAKVRVGNLPLGQRMIRYLKSIINFR